MSTNSKTLYVGGLADEVDPALLEAAFVTFGEIKECKIPVDNKTNNHRGFGFIEFYEEEDALEAMDNMHESEMYGRVLTVKLAKERDQNPEKRTKPIWADDFFYKQSLAAAGITTESQGLGGPTEDKND